MAGSSAYNEGLIGNVNPPYEDSYNSGKIGDEGPIGDDSYNRGRVGGGSIGFGSKPAALHTEFAHGSASPVAYGTQDIVFYLMRADGADADEVVLEKGQPGIEDGLFDDLGNVEVDYSAGSTLTGGSVPSPSSPDNPYSGGQTAAGQIGAAFAAPSLGGGGALAGTINGISQIRELAEDLSSTTQNGGKLDGRDRMVLNAIGSAAEFERDTILAGIGASERMFAKMLNKSFSPEENLEGNRTPEQIKKSLSRASSAELSVQLARETQGIRKVQDLVTLLNEGTIGLTSQKTRAIQSRLSRRGKTRRGR